MGCIVSGMLDISRLQFLLCDGFLKVRIKCAMIIRMKTNRLTSHLDRDIIEIIAGKHVARQNKTIGTEQENKYLILEA
jgi:hypothetical protein